MSEILEALRRLTNRDRKAIVQAVASLDEEGQAQRERELQALRAEARALAQARVAEQAECERATSAAMVDHQREEAALAVQRERTQAAYNRIGELADEWGQSRRRQSARLVELAQLTGASARIEEFRGELRRELALRGQSRSVPHPLGYYDRPLIVSTGESVSRRHAAVLQALDDCDTKLAYSGLDGADLEVAIEAIRAGLPVVETLDAATERVVRDARQKAEARERQVLAHATTERDARRLAEAGAR